MEASQSMAENELATPGAGIEIKASMAEQEQYNEELDLHKDPLKAFYLHGGGAFYNMHELISSLSAMPDEVFAVHVGKDKNDFANWARDVFKTPRLAERMRYFHNKHSLKQFLKTYFESGMAGTGTTGKTAAQAPGAEAKEGQNVQEALESILLKNKAKIAAGEGAKAFTEDEAAEVLKRVKEHEKNKYSAIASQETTDKIDRIRDRILALKKIIIEKRREGIDLFFTTLLLKRLDPQIKISLASNEEKDVQKLLGYIEEIERTFQEETATPGLDVKSEVMALAAEKTRQHDEALKAKAEAASAQETTAASQGAPGAMQGKAPEGAKGTG